MKYIKGVALASLPEQIEGGDEYPVHPDIITIRDQHLPVQINFESDRKVGMTTRLFRADGRLMFEAQIDDDLVERMFKLKQGEGLRYLKLIADTASIGYMLNEYTADKKLIPGGRVYFLGLVQQSRNANTQHPAWEEFEPATHGES